MLLDQSLYHLQSLSPSDELLESASGTTVDLVALCFLGRRGCLGWLFLATFEALRHTLSHTNVTHIFILEFLSQFLSKSGANAVKWWLGYSQLSWPAPITEICLENFASFATKVDAVQIWSILLTSDRKAEQRCKIALPKSVVRWVIGIRWHW